MATFAYRAARPDGSTLDGQIDGEEEQLVKAKLESQGLLVFKVQRRGSSASSSSLGLRSLRRLPVQEFLVFNQELLALIKA